MIIVLASFTHWQQYSHNKTKLFEIDLANLSLWAQRRGSIWQKEIPRCARNDTLCDFCFCCILFHRRWYAISSGDPLRFREWLWGNGAWFGWLFYGWFNNGWGAFGGSWGDWVPSWGINDWSGANSDAKADWRSSSQSALCGWSLGVGIGWSFQAIRVISLGEHYERSVLVDDSFWSHCICPMAVVNFEHFI